jgi:hypothetical protein
LCRQCVGEDHGRVGERAGVGDLHGVGEQAVIRDATGRGDGLLSASLTTFAMGVWRYSMPASPSTWTEINGKMMT